MSSNIIEKIWASHCVHQVTDGPAIFAIDVMLMHEVTSAQAFEVIRKKGMTINSDVRIFATVDHSIPTSSDRNNIEDSQAKIQIETLRKNCKDFSIPLFDIDSGHQGIVHVIGPEQGITQPGQTIVCGDSHTSTHGAFGALAFGIGTTEISHVLGTGCMLQARPKTMKVSFEGFPDQGTYAKDVILKLIASIGIGGATGHIIEYTGAWVESLSMEERMTLCNMSIECGARAGLIAPDETTYRWLKGRPYAPKAQTWEEALRQWNSLQSDPKCSYDKEVSIDIAHLKPMVTWGTSPDQAVEIDSVIPDLTHASESQKIAAKNALDYHGLSEGQAVNAIPVQWAFLGSCTNGRIEDLRISANILKDRFVHPDVTFYVVPGSEQVFRQAQDEGLDKIFTESGAIFRQPGCSMCLGMNPDKVPSGQRCISSSNRNFVGRQGKGSFTHLASPATVTESAIQGKIQHHNLI